MKQPEEGPGGENTWEPPRNGRKSGEPGSLADTKHRACSAVVYIESLFELCADRDATVLFQTYGVMLAKSGDHRNAAIQFQKALEINPQDLSAKANLARLRNLLGNPALK